MVGNGRQTLWPPSATATLNDAWQTADLTRHSVEDWIKSQPVLALSLSFGLGVFLGWLVKRR
jgi:hypothetical protein